MLYVTLTDLAASLQTRLLAAHETVATAESCTGGMIAATITASPGSSAMFETGFVTYANRSKEALLGVPAQMLTQHGAVSDEVVGAMCAGLLERTEATLAVAVSGIAGPGGATPTKPEGRVHIAVQRRGRPALIQKRDYGPIGRHLVRLKTVEDAFALMHQALDDYASANPPRP